MSNRYFYPVLAVSVLLFALAPVFVAWAPYEATMGLIQKIFYFHVPAAMVMFVSAFVCGIGSVLFLFKGNTRADRMALAAGELVAVFGVVVLISGPLWARKAWGVWWQWDARLTSTLVLWMIFSPTCCSGATAGRARRSSRRASRCSAWRTCPSCTSR